MRRRRHRAVPLRALVAVFALVVGIPEAAAWESNVFRSPTGNIVCLYVASGSSVSPSVLCVTRNDLFWVRVDRTGPGRGVRITRALPGNKGVPVLGYGQVWTSSPPRFRCSSSQGGMTCKNVKTGHGFFTSRESYRVW